MSPSWLVLNCQDYVNLAIRTKPQIKRLGISRAAKEARDMFLQQGNCPHFPLLAFLTYSPILMTSSVLPTITLTSNLWQAFPESFRVSSLGSLTLQPIGPPLEEDSSASNVILGDDYLIPSLHLPCSF
ncbi:hypothetical protein N7G274_005447 [Stereocaulon virgatum]|uniref:Uncharacterized protein n=1 Tax=Stereocaulon virgatum TaxID=373712 RepID=A0ABR4AE54_9LECA